MFEEVPIVIKNSHLMTVLMWELEDKSTLADKHELLSLSSRSELTIIITGTHLAKMRSLKEAEERFDFSCIALLKIHVIPKRLYRNPKIPNE